jgi:hypothetical protein
MKAYIADNKSESETIYLAVHRAAGEWIIFETEIEGLCAVNLKELTRKYESLTADERLFIVEEAGRFFARIEGEEKYLNDFKVSEVSGELPEWLLLDDYGYHEEALSLLHTPTKSLFLAIEEDDGKPLLKVLECADERLVPAAMDFISKMIDTKNL